MPMVRNIQAASVQGRTQRPQAASIRPSIRAATAKEKDMLIPTYPRYRNSGWKANPGSCRSGFRSRPFSGGSARRRKGFDVNRMKA